MRTLNAKLERELLPHKKRLENLQAELTDVVENFHVELPERPAPEVNPDETDWLFDSSREYLAQLEFYEARKKGETK